MKYLTDRERALLAVTNPPTPRDRSRLPAKFTDRECAACVWLYDRRIAPWSVDMLTKEVGDHRGATDVTYRGLIEFAVSLGWRG